MKEIFRIHGDNIVECERIAKLIISEISSKSIDLALASPSTIIQSLHFSYENEQREWQLELLPGFNKAGRHRWEGNIFSSLKENGSFLDETPDAIITKIIDGDEKILLAIEFCSALQAGNQAWQRSGRAYSTGRTGCPYLYIVDFVKYELDPKSRERKALRFPNPAVPYSYINFSKTTGNFVAQVYTRSEEFDKSGDPLLSYFDEDDFADKDLSKYIVKKMCGSNTANEESTILKKNLNVVRFLAASSNPKTNFTSVQWNNLYESGQDIIPFSIRNSAFNFHKIISAKGHHGKSAQFISLVDVCSVGLASRDLPFGIIPASSRAKFANGIRKLYPKFNQSILDKIGSPQKDLILCVIKGFKPRGDDNRPDRGILPLAAMLSSEEVEIMTYIYGPLLLHNFNLLQNNPKLLGKQNGFWKVILGLSNYVALDVPILSSSPSDEVDLIDTTALKNEFTQINTTSTGLIGNAFSNIPTEFHEDDVDTGIHFLFAHLLNAICFEGMCNPPGGDWSGLSILSGNKEVRWLSLPRVSDDVDGKRPDHVLQLSEVFDKPLLLSIESKERSIDLEPNVGNGLVNYITHLLSFTPNVERQRGAVTPWSRATAPIDIREYEVISAAAYLKHASQPNDVVFRNSKCNILFLMEPIPQGWFIEIVPNTPKAEHLKNFIIKKVKETGFKGIEII